MNDFPGEKVRISSGIVADRALLDLAVYRTALEDGVVLGQFEAVRRILAVFLRDITGGAWHAAFFMLGAFENDLNAVAFALLCH